MILSLNGFCLMSPMYQDTAMHYYFAMFFPEAYFKYRFRFFKITDSIDNNLQILLSSVQPLKN
jgi:hypothetical protein